MTESILYKTIGDVLRALGNGTSIGQLEVGLRQVVEKIFNQLGQSLPESLSEAREILAVFPSKTKVDKATAELWQEEKNKKDAETEMEVKALDEETRQRLLTEYEQAMKAKQANKEGILKRLAKKYGIKDVSAVDLLIKRLETKYRETRELEIHHVAIKIVDSVRSETTEITSENKVKMVEEIEKYWQTGKYLMGSDGREVLQTKLNRITGDNSPLLARQIAEGVEVATRQNMPIIREYTLNGVVGKAMSDFKKENGLDGIKNVKEIEKFRQYTQQATAIALEYSLNEKESVEAEKTVRQLRGQPPTEVGFRRANAIVAMLRAPEEDTEFLMESRKSLESTGLSLSSFSPNSLFGSINNVVGVISKHTDIFKQFKGAQNIVAWTDKLRPQNIVISLAKKVGLEERVIQWVGQAGARIGIQGAGEMAGNIMTIAGEGGIKTVVSNVLRQIATTGAVTATEGAAATGAAGAGAVGAGGVVATLASGPAAPIVAAVIVIGIKLISLFKKAKKIIGKLDKQLRKINLGLPSIKRFVEDTLGIGGLPGKVISGAIGFTTSILVIFSAPFLLIGTTLIGPIVIGLFVFIFISSTFRNMRISSLVPPQTGGGESGGLYENIDEGEILFEGEIPEGCPYGWPVSSGRVTQGPATGDRSTHHGVIAESIDFGANEGTGIIATHKGGVSCRMGHGYGYFVDLTGDCDGIKFTTRYGHLLEGSAMHCGEVVEAGTIIGLVDNTGNSTGNHLHYEIVNKVLGDIRQYLPQPKGKQIPRGCVNYNECLVTVP
ncbi:hypothetical protein DRH14_04315 [Candidatus Shapirobacteria bacterium]|nr:MAG: hypothetical protein DRH14_04315 [Candidatus Shapirobacteria bacterium]